MTTTIGFVFGGQFPCGGAEKVTLDVGQALAREGYRVIVFCREVVPSLLPADCALHIIEYRQKLKDKASADELASHIREHGIRILTYVCTEPYFASQIRQQTGVRIVHASHTLPFWETLHKKARKERLKDGNLWQRLQWYCYYNVRFNRLHVYDRKYAARYARTLRSVDAFTVLCPEYKALLQQTLQLSAQEAQKIHVTPNYLLPVRQPRTEKEKAVIFVGRLSYTDKRVDRLLRIWAAVEPQCPDWQLLIIGDGPEERNLRALAARLQLQHVSFEGRHADTRPYYERAAILCLTSSYEGWPLVIMEAQANGVVPVAFNCCAGVENLLTNGGENGVLVTPFDLDEFARQLTHLIKDEDARHEMQRHVLSLKYPLEETCKAHVTLYESLLNTE